MAKSKRRMKRKSSMGGGGWGKPTKGFWNAGRAMVLVFVILGGIVTAGGLAYQSDEVYLQDKTNTTSTFNSRMVSGSNQAMIVTTTDSLGEAIPDESVKITLIDENETEYVLFEGMTGESGSVEPIISIPEDFEGDLGTLEIEAAGETVSRSVEVTTATVEEQAGARIIISTDKPIYQPDQTVRIRTLGFEGSELRASEKDVTIEVLDPEGNKIFKKVIPSNEYGVAAMDYPLSDQLPTGNYQIMASLGSLAMTNKTLLVKRYVLPMFKIDLDGARTWYTADETIEGTIKVDYFFGKHVQGQIDVEAKVYRGIWETVQHEQTTLDENGEFDLTIAPVEYAAGLDLNQGNGYLELNVSVTDTGGHNEHKTYMITIAQAPISIVLLADTNLEGTDSTYTAICRYPTGVPVQDATVAFKIGENKYVKRSDERGLATVTFPYNGEDKLKISVVKDENAIEESFDIKASEGIKVIPDKYYYELGDEAKFDVHYQGSSLTAWAYYDVISNGFTIATGHIKLSGGKGSFKISVDRAMSPISEVRVYKIEKGMDVIKDAVAISIEGLKGLHVTVLPDKQTYRPNGEVTIDFKVEDAEGAGTPSILGINVVDMAVFELSERLVGLDEIFWAMNDDYQEPTYQVLDYVYKQDSYDLEYDKTVQVSKCMCAEEHISLESSWSAHLDDAADYRQEKVEEYWSALAIIGIAGYLGLIVMALKFRRLAVGLIMVMVIITATLSGMMATYVHDFNDDGERDGDTAPAWDGDGAMEEGGPMKTGANDPGVLGGFPTPPALFDDDPVRDKEEKQSNAASEDTSADKPAHVRDYFPETWYWNPTLITDENGMASVTLIAPDSITSWGVDAVASTKDARFGAGKTNVTVFQEFFVEPDIPVSVVRNDTFPLRVLIYNYLETNEDVRVELLPADWYDLVGTQSTKVVNVKAESVANATFTIRATKVGMNDVSVISTAGEWTDAIIKPMLVEPDGKQMEEIFNGELSDDDEGTATLVLDPNRVEMSENAYIKLQASMEAVAIDGAEGYIHFVSGCGEQSLSTLNIDILAYDAYVRSGGASTEKLVEFEVIVTQGIQHELQYLKEGKNKEGRGIVWFPSDQDVHPWLTSWGLITFQDGRNAGFMIDEAIITDMQDWLVSQQIEDKDDPTNDGSWKFPEWGLYEFSHPTLENKRIASTAYILRALLYSGYDPDSEVVQKAIKYIESHVDEVWDDPYTLSISLLTLEDADGDLTKRRQVSDRVHHLANRDAVNGTYWDSDTNMLTDGKDDGWDWGGRSSTPSAHSIETTGYVVMAQKEAGKRVDSSEGVSWLLEHRSAHGYRSTQDTVVAFQALLGSGTADVEDMDISIFADGQLVDEVHFDKANKELTVLVDLRPYLDRVDGDTDIRLVSQGEGTLLYQVYLEQYLPWSEENRSAPEEMELAVDYSTLNIKVDDTIKATLSMTYKGDAEYLKMVLIEIKAPVGFYFVTEDLDKLVENGAIDLYELGPGEASLYIQNIRSDKTYTLSYGLLCKKPVKATIQGVHVWDMYNPAVDTELLPIEVVATA